MISAEAILQLTKNYTEPHRAYHNLSHITSMLTVAPLTPEQVLAIWFHDAIYIPGARDNEEKSADLAMPVVEDLVSAGILPSSATDLVHTMILDTRKHVPRTEPSRLVVDLDLMILASPREEYIKYSQQIRQEYSAITDEFYVPGRLGFLKEFLKRDRIYWDMTQLEDPARSNLEFEIGFLEGHANVL